MCTTAHERVDVVAFRKDYVSHWGTIKHRVVRGSGPEVEALLGKPYEYRFSPEEQAVLKVTLHDKPDGTQERPLLVRWQAASHQGPSPIAFQIVEVLPLDATSMCSQVIFHDEATSSVRSTTASVPRSRFNARSMTENAANTPRKKRETHTKEA